MISLPDSAPERFERILMIAVQQVVKHGDRRNNYRSGFNEEYSFISNFGRWT